MIVEKIRDYLGSKDLNSDLTTRVKLALNAVSLGIVDKLNNQLIPRSHGRAGRLYPSDATKCSRRLAYEVLDFPKEPFTIGAKLKFLIGDLVESAALALIASATEVKDNNKPFDVLIADKARRGRSDGIVTIDGQRVNLEIKSMADYAFKKFEQEGIDDTWGYQGQANVYMRQQIADDSIDKPGNTLFFVVNRDTGDINERFLPYNPEVAHAADENFRYVETCLDEKKLPMRTVAFQGKSVVQGQLVNGNKLPLVCSYCAYKHSCYTEPAQRVSISDDGSPIYSKSPTRVVQMTMVKGYKGAFKPSWGVVDA
jgi:hypothetical protein